MDLQAYFGALRSVEESFEDDSVIVVSLATADGGVAGRTREVTPAQAARMIVERKARLSSEQERDAHRSATVNELDEWTEREVSPRLNVRLPPVPDGRGAGTRGRKG